MAGQSDADHTPMRCRDIWVRCSAFLTLFASVCYGEEGEKAPAKDIPPPALVLQLGHAGYPAAASLAPSGREFVTAEAAAPFPSGAPRRLLVWDAATGRQLRTLEAPTGLLGGGDALAYSPGGRHILLNEVLLDRRTGVVVQRFTPRDEYELLYGAAFDPEGKHVLLGVNHSAMRIRQGGRAHGLLRLFKIESGRLVRTFRPPEGSTVRAAAYGPQAKRVAALEHRGEAHADRHVTVWDVKSGAELVSFAVSVHDPDPEERRWQFERHGELLFHPHEPRLFVASGRSVVECDLAKGKPVRKYAEARGRIRALAVSPDGRSLLVADDVGAVLHDTASGRVLHAFAGARSTLGGFSANGEYFLMLNRDRGKPAVADLWHLGRRLRVSSVPVRPYASGEIPRVFSVRYTSAGDRLRLLVGGKSSAKEEAADLAVITFDLARVQVAGVQRLLPGSGFHDLDFTRSYAWTPDGNGLLTEAPDRPEDVVLWDLDGGRIAARFRGHAKSLRCAAVSADGKRAVTAASRDAANSGQSLLVVWDMESGQALRKIVTREKESIQAVALSPGAERVIGRLFSGDVLVFDGRSGDRLAKLEIPRGMASVGARLAMRPDGAQALSLEVPAVVWDLVKFREAGLLFGRGVTLDLAYRPDGALIATGGFGDAIRLWDSASLDLRRTIPLEATPRCLAWRPDGKQLAWARDDGGFVALLDADTGAPQGSLILTRQGQEWLAVTPTGHFAGSPDLLRRVGWKVSGQVFPLELYAWVFHRPEIVAHSFRGGDPKTAPPLKVAAEPPRVHCAVEKMEHRSVTCRIEARAAADTKIDRIRVYVDGRDLEAQQGRALEPEVAQDGSVRVRCVVDFPPGKTKAVVAAVATDARGLASLPSALTIVRPGTAEAVERTLYVVAVGVSRYKNPELNLPFGHADATAIADVWKAQEGLAFDHVVARVLTDDGATVPAIREALRWLSERATPRDVAIVFFTGHGASLPGGLLYYVTHEADVRDVAGTCLPWDDLAKGLQGVRAAQVLFLSECCHAGAFGGSRPSQADLAAPLLRDSRVMVFASSRGLEVSFAMGKLGHGAFTDALLKGLEGAADLIPDRRITISELQTYVANRVKQTTDDMQHPHIPLMQDFDPELVIAHLK